MRGQKIHTTYHKHTAIPYSVCDANTTEMFHTLIKIIPLPSPIAGCACAASGCCALQFTVAGAGK